jgi:hypothetical protein
MTGGIRLISVIKNSNTFKGHEFSGRTRSMAPVAAVTIDRFIFHVLTRVERGFRVHLLPEVMLSAQARGFFERLFAKDLNAIRYVFDDNAVGADAVPPLMATEAQNLLTQDADLNALSGPLTQRFADLHAPQATDGVFIVSTGTLNGRQVVFLMKYDHIEAVELLTGDGIPDVRFTEEALTLDEHNVKKFALIDPQKAEGWHVLATDRQTPPIADYFRRFLGVKPFRGEAEQTHQALVISKRWAAETDTLPENLHPTDVQYRAVDYLRQHNVFQVDGFMDRLFGAETDDNRQAREALRQRLADNDLIASFGVDRSEISTQLERQVVTTAEGVRIIMPRGPKAGNVMFDEQDGRCIITIETTEVKTIR